MFLVFCEQFPALSQWLFSLNSFPKKLAKRKIEPNPAALLLSGAPAHHQAKFPQICQYFFKKKRKKLFTGYSPAF
ncbi:MAG: hypothetical protein C5B50_29430 [Verrucomicrobia bacterium]|nr:MAG: hypothetical protein C5B50_29430 [Verrucomicrobiota bacterium]